MVGEINGIGKKRQHLISSVISFMEKELNLSNILIDVEVSYLFQNERAYGFCSHSSANEYTIELDQTLDLYDLIETICHEMIHVKQYAFGELVDRGTKALYKNHLYEIDDVSSPWEQEAYEKESLYMNLFLKIWNQRLNTIDSKK